MVAAGMTPSSTHLALALPRRGSTTLAARIGSSRAREREPTSVPTDARPATHTPNAKYALNWGMLASTIPIAMVDRDLGAFLSVSHSRQYFGYRRDPFAARHSFSLGFASSGLKPFASYSGTFRRLLRDLDATVHLEYSGVETVRFTGFGNDTQLLGSSDFYKVEQKIFVFSPAIEFRREQRHGEAHAGGTKPRRSETAISLGPIVKYSSTPLSANQDKYIASLDHLVYGMDSFGQAGAQGRVEYDTRNNPAYPTSGLVVRGTGAIYPGAWDAKSAFGTAEGAVHAYLTARIPTTPTLALRAGGKKVWGTFPFHRERLPRRARLCRCRHLRQSGPRCSQGPVCGRRLGVCKCRTALRGCLLTALDAGRVRRVSWR